LAVLVAFETFEHVEAVAKAGIGRQPWSQRSERTPERHMKSSSDSLSTCVPQLLQ
jgi:hypothetical protein